MSVAQSDITKRRVTRPATELAAVTRPVTDEVVPRRLQHASGRFQDAINTILKPGVSDTRRPGSARKPPGGTSEAPKDGARNQVFWATRYANAFPKKHPENNLRGSPTYYQQTPKMYLGQLCWSHLREYRGGARRPQSASKTCPAHLGGLPRHSIRRQNVSKTCSSII